MSHVTKLETYKFNNCCTRKKYFRGKIKCTSLPKRSLQTNCSKLAPEISQNNSAALVWLGSTCRDKQVVVAKLVCAFLTTSQW